jgi:hypothetical protein
MHFPCIKEHNRARPTGGGRFPTIFPSAPPFRAVQTEASFICLEVRADKKTDRLPRRIHATTKQGNQSTSPSLILHAKQSRHEVVLDFEVSHRRRPTLKDFPICLLEFMHLHRERGGGVVRDS